MVKNKSHTLAYSLIALQEMNLAFKYPIIFWNTACLITDAGGAEEDEQDESSEEETTVTYYNEMEEFGPDDSEADIVDEYEEEEVDGYPAEVVVLKSGKKKKKIKSTNYGKIASAIGKFTSAHIQVALPDINRSNFTFTPDVDNNAIRYGLSGITQISADLVKEIIAARPYSSVEDFLSKIKIKKPQMINLIKAGAFDNFGDRLEVMKSYILSISDQKKRVTLQNLQMLINFNLIPDEYDMARRTFNFNKYLKKMALDGTYLGLDAIAFAFYEKHFDLDLLKLTTETESGFKIAALTWKKLYDKEMDKVRPYVKNNAARLLESMNNRLFQDTWNKYCSGTLSKWEMESVSYYSHEHELSSVNLSEYGLSDFFSLPDQPIIERFIPIKGRQVPIYKLSRIAGTVLDRDKAKKTVTLLTTNGVVTVKIYGGVFQVYDAQISEKGADGKKHVIEKSAFKRGNKIIVTGIRDEDSFICKTYSKTPFHKVEIIDRIDNGILYTRNRVGME